MCSEKYDEKSFSYTKNSNSWANAVEDQCHVDSCPSDCESAVSGGENQQQHPVSDKGLFGHSGGEMIQEMITKNVVASLSLGGFDAKVEAIKRVDFSSFMSRAKLQSFCIFSRAVEMKCGDANVKYAWFGGLKSEINSILSHGFTIPKSNKTHGCGVYLSPLESLQLAAGDGNGLTHMLLCRVIMGEMETILPNSSQYNPSSEKFDSGVDDLSSPRKYIVWSSRMNTHILPEYVVRFKSSSYRETGRNLQPVRVPSSEWMPFPALITALSKFSPCDAVELVSKYHSDYRKKKVTRQEMIERMRDIAGDKLLMAIIKSHWGKNLLIRRVSLAQNK